MLRSHSPILLETGLERRRDCGLAPQQMADRLGISQRVRSGYERGELRLHGELIVQIARILKVSSDGLLGIKRARDPATRKATHPLNRLRQVEQVPPADQSAAFKFVDGLVHGREITRPNDRRKAS